MNKYYRNWGILKAINFYFYSFLIFTSIRIHIYIFLIFKIYNFYFVYKRQDNFDFSHLYIGQKKVWFLFLIFSGEKNIKTMIRIQSTLTKCYSWLVHVFSQLTRKLMPLVDKKENANTSLWVIGIHFQFHAYRTKLCFAFLFFLPFFSALELAK